MFHGSKTLHLHNACKKHRHTNKYIQPPENLYKRNASQRKNTHSGMFEIDIEKTCSSKKKSPPNDLGLVMIRPDPKTIKLKFMERLIWFTLPLFVSFALGIRFSAILCGDSNHGICGQCGGSCLLYGLCQCRTFWLKILTTKENVPKNIGLER